MIWYVIATLCAYYVKGLCGFANTLVFTSVLGFTKDNINITPLDVLIGYPSNIIITWKERKSLNYRIWLPVVCMVVIGMIPGIYILRHSNTSIIKILFGFVVIILAIDMLLREITNRKSKESKITMFIIGILSGMLCGIFGVGALVATYMNKVTKNSEEFRANICAVFFFDNTIRIIIYIVSGILTFSIMKQAILLYPVMLLGMYFGMMSGKVFNEKIIKKVVIIMLIISGISMILTNI